MASSASAMNSNQRSREPCRYFLSNKCRYGDKCVYSHDRSNGRINNICRYFLQGRCTYGNRCRYDHVLPNSFAQSSITTAFDNNLYEDSNETDYTNISYNPSVNNTKQKQKQNYSSQVKFQSLCPHAGKDGHCQASESGQYCPYIHGDTCDLCQMPALHPFNEKQREKHRLECSKKHEANCEEAFAIQRSQDKKCGICLETVWDRDGDKRFGMLENCDHIFCLECIRTWRSSSNYEHRVVKACPECRTKSDFVTPTKFWPENEQAKKHLIQSYKNNLQKIHCKFFKRGDGLCPFGSKCFYLHVNKQGQHVELGPPRRRQRTNLRTELENLSEVLMVSLFSPIDVERFFDELDFLFDDDDDMESYGSYYTDEEDLHFADENDLTDNDEDYPSWH